MTRYIYINAACSLEMGDHEGELRFSGSGSEAPYFERFDRPALLKLLQGLQEWAGDGNYSRPDRPVTFRHLLPILCGRCDRDTLVRVGSALSPPFQQFKLGTFGPTHLTQIGLQVKYAVKCAGRVVGRKPGGSIGLVRCGWSAVLTGLETERLLEQVVRRTKRTTGLAHGRVLPQ